MTRFYRDATKQIFEEIAPGRLRGVTAWDGSKYIQNETVLKDQWEALRGPLVEVPNPWMTDRERLAAVEDIVDRWSAPHRRMPSASYLVAELQAALGITPEEVDP